MKENLVRVCVPEMSGNSSLPGLALREMIVSDFIA